MAFSTLYYGGKATFGMPSGMGLVVNVPSAFMMHFGAW